MRMCRTLMAGLAVVASMVIAGCQSTAMTSAKVYIQQNDWAQAREQLLLAVAATPQDTEAQMLLGVAEATAGNLAEAAAAFDAAEFPAHNISNRGDCVNLVKYHQVSH